MSHSHSYNASGSPQRLHTEDETLAIEHAIRAAVNTVMDVIYSACNRRVQEYQRMVADRDAEIRRLECKLEKSESELKGLRLEVGGRQPAEGELSCPATSPHERERGSGEAVKSSSKEHCGERSDISPYQMYEVQYVGRQHNRRHCIPPCRAACLCVVRKSAHSFFYSFIFFISRRCGTTHTNFPQVP